MDTNYQPIVTELKATRNGDKAQTQFCQPQTRFKDCLFHRLLNVAKQEDEIQINTKKWNLICTFWKNKI